MPLNITTSDNTFVTLANLTGIAFDVESSVEPTLSADYWMASNGTLNNSPVPTPAEVLVFSRNTGITDGDTWVFETTFTLDGMIVTFTESEVGQSIVTGSSLQQRLQAGSADSGWWNDGSISLPFTGQSGATYNIDVQQYLTPGGIHNSFQLTVYVTMPAVQSQTPVMTGIETIVMLMLENRSLDNLLGYIYVESNPTNIYGADQTESWNGCSGSNSYGSLGPYDAADGVSNTPSPLVDPGEDFEHVQVQLYGDSYGTLPAAPFWNTKPQMAGFNIDYLLTPQAKAMEISLGMNGINGQAFLSQDIMGGYSAAQAPVISGLAQSYAASDAWYSAAPTQTYANRAFAMCGTSLGMLDNAEINGTTYQYANTIFNLLGGPGGKTWGIYYQDNGGIAAGSPVGHPFTPYFFPRATSASCGGVYEYDDSSKRDAFLQALGSGSLPNFCFVEPAWGGGFPPFVIQGNDYHPPTDVATADAALNTFWTNIQASPQWLAGSMLVIVTFDEHGGTYDHQAPAGTIAPDTATPSPVVGNSGFAFQSLGLRVPTILISPYIAAGTVFRSPSSSVAFDHTSIIATLLKWAGLNPASAGLGARVAQAPTFEGVIGTTLRTDKPTFTSASPSPMAAAWINPFDGPAPLDEHGAPCLARPIFSGDFHAAVSASKSPEEFRERVRALRFGTA